jgi:anti-sigma factor RsiW
MKPIEPTELSAYIDGELDAGRAAEVRAALDMDASLRGQYAALMRADAHLRSVAAAAGTTLHPRVRLPARKPASAGVWRAVPVLVIPAAWLIGKLTAAESLALAASAIAFLTLVVTVVRLALNEAGPPVLYREN